MILFVLAYRDDLLGRLLGPWEELTARMTLALLHALKVEAVRLGSQLHHPGGFAVEVYYRCTAVLAVALLAALTAATPASVRSKLIGLSLGVPVLVGLNLVRLVQLFYLGVFDPGLFDLAHGLLWEIVFILATLGIWWLWARWAVHRNSAGEERDGAAGSIRA